MSTTQATDVNANLSALLQAGTSPWLDLLRRTLVTGGDLARMISEQSLRGMTSNPAIFEKAILESDDYDEELEHARGEGLEPNAIFERIAMHDVRAACDVFRETWESSRHADGFVSLEVPAVLAHDQERTLAAARDYWSRVDRPNLMIKIPGTPEGLGAIEQAIYEGINVNITLLFAVDAYERVADAYLRGLERRQADSSSVDVASVASFFVSRVDTAVDQRLEALGRQDLFGLAAIANARLAYERFESIFSGPRWQALGASGAKVQRPLWASTGVKSPRYPDTMYVDELVAPHTVNTMPLNTLEAVADHGRITGPTATHDPHGDLAALSEAGIDMTEVTDELLSDGVKLFEEAMSRLLAGIEQRISG